MNDGCGERRIALGAYAIGALDPAERDQVEDHLARCAGCREELAALVEMTPVLGRLSAAEAAAARPPLAAGSRGSVVERTLAELARHRRNARRRWQAAMAGGVAAVAALGVAVAVLVVTRPAAAPVEVAAAHLSGSDAGTGVSASAQLYTEFLGNLDPPRRLRGQARGPVRAGGDRQGRLGAGGGDLARRLHRRCRPQRFDRDRREPDHLAESRDHLGLRPGRSAGLSPPRRERDRGAPAEPLGRDELDLASHPRRRSRVGGGSHRPPATASCRRSSRARNPPAGWGRSRSLRGCW